MNASMSIKIIFMIGTICKVVPIFLMKYFSSKFASFFPAKKNPSGVVTTVREKGRDGSLAYAEGSGQSD